MWSGLGLGLVRVIRVRVRLERQKDQLRRKEGRVVQRPVVVAMAPASAARGMAVTPACKLSMACHLSKNARGGMRSGAVQRGMRREANPGNTERGRAGQRGKCGANVWGVRGAAVAAPSRWRGGLGHGGGRKGGGLARGSGGRGA